MELSRVEKFFDGQEIFYEEFAGDTAVRVTMKEAEKKEWQNGVDYVYKGKISVNALSGTSSKVEWGYDFFKVSGGGDLGLLFDDLSSSAQTLHALLCMKRTTTLRMDDLVTCLFNIKEQVKGEFRQGEEHHNGSFLRQDLYDKYIDPYMPKDD